jgi:HK97 family phage portal protein
MNALARFFAALRSAPPRQPSLESPRLSSPAWWGTGNRIPSDLVLTTDQQMSVSVAWACIRAIVDPIAASEIKVYEERDGKRIEEKDWIWWLINVEPHPQYTAQGWIEVMGTRAVALGDSYAYLRRDGSQRAASMQPLDTARMRADETSSGTPIYLYSDPKNGEVELSESEVIHFRGPRTGGFYGDSAMARAAAALALSKAQEEYATSYYANGAYPGVLLKPPTDMAKGGAMSREEKQTLREIWKALFGGPRNAHGVATMDPGWELEVVETDAQKAQMIEARRFQVAEICRYFGVPGHLVGVPEASQGYGKNLAELGIAFTRYTLEPWTRRFEEELRRKLLPTRRQGQSWFVEFDLERLKQGDAESVARAAEIDIRNGVLTINQAKALRGLPSVEGGDVTLVNGKPLEQILKPPPPPVAAPPPVDKDDEGEPEKPETAEAVASVKTRPVSLTAALEQHARRAKASAGYLRRVGKGAEVEAHAERLRERARVEVLALAPALPSGAITIALLSVEQGVSPDKAAAHLLGAA